MKTALLLLLSLMCIKVQSQIDYGEYQGKSKVEKKNYVPPKPSEEFIWKIKNKTDSLDYELYYLRYHLEKYREQTAKGRRVMVCGVFISAASIVLSPPTSNVAIAGTALGGTVFVIGGLISWTSTRWLRNATLKPTSYGVSLTVDF